MLWAFENFCSIYFSVLVCTQYKFRDRLQPLLEAGGAKIVSIEGFCSSSQVYGSCSIFVNIFVFPSTKAYCSMYLMFHVFSCFILFLNSVRIFSLLF